MSRPRYEVIVAGAGMVGASAALALAARGMSVALIEPVPAATSPGPDPDADYDLRVSAISPRSRSILQRLGIRFPKNMLLIRRSMWNTRATPRNKSNTPPRLWRRSASTWRC